MVAVRIELSDITVDEDDNIGFKCRLFEAVPGVGWSFTGEEDVEPVSDIATEVTTILDAAFTDNITPAP